MSKNFHHKVSVLGVLPRVELLLFINLVCIAWLWDLERISELPEERIEQKEIVDFVLDIVRQLVKHLLLILIVNSLILIVRPLVIKVCLNMLLQVLINRCVVVEFTDEAEEAGELHSLVNWIVQFTKTVNDLK